MGLGLTCPQDQGLWKCQQRALVSHRGCESECEGTLKYVQSTNTIQMAGMGIGDGDDGKRDMR